LTAHSCGVSPTTRENERPGRFHHCSTVRGAVGDAPATQYVLTDAEALRSLLLHSLLKGRYHSVEGFNRDGRVLGIHLLSRYFFVSIISIGATISKQTEDSILRHLRSMLPPGIDLLADTATEAATVICVLGTDATDRRNLRDILKHLHKMLKQEYELEVNIGCGGLCRNLKDLGKSYLEATSAAEFSLAKNTALSFHDEMPSLYEFASTYPTDVLRRFHFSLATGDMTAVKEALSALLAHGTACDTPLLTIQALKCDVATIVGRHEENNGLASVTDLRGIPTLEAFVDQVSSHCRRICQRKRVGKRQETAIRLGRLLDYLDEHHLEQSFCLQSMADHFGMTASNLSHYFKAHFGEKLSAYVQSRRIERTKELLSTTSMTVAEIVDSTGYCARTSFTRKFRSVTGVTPGQYRVLQKRP
jgi:two-component system response regulator YesN